MPDIIVLFVFLFIDQKLLMSASVGWHLRYHKPLGQSTLKHIVFVCCLFVFWTAKHKKPRLVFVGSKLM